MHTDLLFNSPHIRFSRQASEAVLSYARAVGARNVPTYYAWKKFQEKMQEKIGLRTEPVITQSGNLFYMNSILGSLQMVSERAKELGPNLYVYSGFQ